MTEKMMHDLIDLLIKDLRGCKADEMWLDVAEDRIHSAKSAISMAYMVEEHDEQ